MTWKTSENKLVKIFECSSFSDIINRLDKLAKYADAQNHHPDFSVYDYKKIRFELWTHTKNTVTAADHEMAVFIDNLFC